jgi:RNA polymerase sigma-54 factor
MVPLLELQEKITQELADNPVLELEKTPGEDLAGDMISDASEYSKDDIINENSAKNDEELAQLIQLADSWQDYLPPSHSREYHSSEDDEKRQHFFDSLAEEPSLQEQLIEQLRLSDADNLIKNLAEIIIGSIDDNGYLRSHLADIAITGNAEIEKVEEALDFVQGFEPAGIGARDLKECLLLQLARTGQTKGPLVKLIKNHLDDIAKNRLPLISKKMKISIDELYELLSELRSLTPHPGSLMAPSTPIYVIPEVVLEKTENGFAIASSEDQMPRLRISKLYRQLLEAPDTPKETIDYIKTKLTSGKMLIKSLEQRQSTIKRIAKVIIDTQYDFLEKGVEYLHPLTMQQVADKLDLHETTISRAIANKYIQTPYGLFEFKYFFSGGYQSESGEELSSKSVKEKIRDMILTEDSTKPLSDSKIAKLLKEKGVPVARRTVAKYREEMGIASSHLRKEF